MDNFFYPIHEVISDEDGRGIILGKNGSLTYVVKMSLPEVYSLDKEEIETRHHIYTKAFSRMPDNTTVHKQDVFRRKKYQSFGDNLSYLSQADQKHFAGREYLEHTCVIGFTLSGLNSLSGACSKRIYSFKEHLLKEDNDRLKEFLDAVEFSINNLSSLRNTEIRFFSVAQLNEYILSSTNFFDATGVKDLHFAERITANNITAKMYAIVDDELLPDELDVSTKDLTVSREQSELYMSPGEAFGGIHFNHNHIYNQVLYFYSDKKLKSKMRKNLDDHITNRGWDRINIPPKVKKMEELINDINENKEILCYAHYSILLWDEDMDRLNVAENALRSILDVMHIKCYTPGYENLATVYGGGIVGCTASLPVQYMFMTSLSLATSLLIHYTAFKNDDEGVLFNERLSQIPLRKDIWDAKGKRVKARNSVVIAPTGGGKSFTTNNIIHQLLDSGYTVVAVEFGNSFKQLCYLYPETSMHIEYDSSLPLGINPFDLGGERLAPDKEEILVTLCLRFWGNPDAGKEQITSLRKFLGQYYREKESGHSFQGFYTYLTGNFEKVCNICDVSPDYFDVESFKHICSEFMPGGTYANLCSSEGIASNLSEKRFIHFELTKVKSDPFVASVVMSMLFDVINYKILSDPSKKGYIIFDEYAETAQMKSTTSLDVDIHQTVAFFYQKIRKENGAVMTIIQSPVQLPDNEYTKGIIANTQLLYVLEGSEVVYDEIINTFKIKNPAHINQMKSLQNNYSCAHPYSECWIRFGEKYALTVRIEASRRKFLAFQTQGEIRSALDGIYKSNGNDMQAAIEQYIREESVLNKHK